METLMANHVMEDAIHTPTIDSNLQPGDEVNRIVPSKNNKIYVCKKKNDKVISKCIIYWDCE